MAKAKKTAKKAAPKKATVTNSGSKATDTPVMDKAEAQAIVNKYASLGPDAGEPAELVTAREVLAQQD